MGSTAILTSHHSDTDASLSLIFPALLRHNWETKVVYICMYNALFWLTYPYPRKLFLWVCVFLCVFVENIQDLLSSFSYLRMLGITLSPPGWSKIIFLSPVKFVGNFSSVCNLNFSLPCSLPIPKWKGLWHGHLWQAIILSTSSSSLRGTVVISSHLQANAWFWRQSIFKLFQGKCLFSLIYLFKLPKIQGGSIPLAFACPHHLFS